MNTTKKSRRPTVSHRQERGKKALEIELLIIVRHGNYDGMGLTPSGRQQIEEVANSIRPYLNGKKVKLLTSPLKRAVDSAEILATMLDISYEEKSFLRSKGGDLSSENIRGALMFLRRAKSQVVIFSTHFEFGEDFPDVIDEKLFKIRKLTPVSEMPRGSAWVIDCKTGECVLIP